MTSLFLARQPETDIAYRQFTEFAADRRDDWSKSVLNSLTARRALYEGRIDEALEWALAYDAPVAGVEPFTFVESPTLTRGKVLTSLEDRSLVQVGLEHLLNAEPHLACSTHHMIDLHVLTALAYHRLGRTAESRAALSRALALAAPGGSKLPFLEPGHIMLELLSGMPVDEPSGLFVQSVKSSLEHGDLHNGATRSQRLPEEPLTNRELDILVLVSERLRNKEVAARLFVSSETVKTHLKNIYRKLGVSNRSQARERAAEILSDRV
jgi:LuxR family maltose regulon positive regulatory protein